MLGRVLNHWNNYWFDDRASATTLAIYRILMFSGMLFMLVISFGGMYFKRSCLTYEPFGVFRLLDIPCSLDFYFITYAVAVVFCVPALLGAFYGVTGKVAAIAAMLFFGYDNNFSEIYHSYQLVVMAWLIVGFGRGAHALSLDSWFNKYEQKNSFHFSWPVKMASCYVVYVYFIVGVEKLYYSGLLWAFSENLMLHVLLAPQVGYLTEWFLNLPYWAIVGAASWSLFIVELLCPLALFHRYFGYFFFVNWIGFHVGVYLTLGGHLRFFSQILAASVFLIPLLEGQCSRLLKRYNARS